MLKSAKGCLSTILTTAVLVTVAFVGWRYGDRIFPVAMSILGVEESAAPEDEPSPSRAIAEAALERYQDLLDGSPGDTASFSGLEATSMLRFSFSGMVPEGLVDPEIRMREGQLRLRARVSRDAFPSFPRLEGVLEILPDTVPLTVDGSLLPFDETHLSVVVEGIDASAIPVPRRFYPDILDAVGRRPRSGLPPNAVAIPLPDGLARAYVDGDRLVLVAGD